MVGLKEKWEKEGRGTIFGSNCSGKCRISFAMFADDTTLVAKSRPALKKMLQDVSSGLAEIGLNLNADKCYIQSSTSAQASTLQMEGASYPIVSNHVGFKVLGTTFTLNGSTDAEFERRMQAAYGKFHQLWPLLGKRDTSLRKRLQLFQATVSQSALWCCDSWTLTAAQKRHLRAVQRNLLRRFAGPRRKPDEDYLTWIRRATLIVDRNARDAGCECWLKQYLTKKWHWAGKIARMSPE